jgi:hypothetical protein
LLTKLNKIIIISGGNFELRHEHFLYFFIYKFLSYGQLKEYLSILIENNLIEYLDGTHKFKTTEKGLNFLKMHYEIGELLHITA